MSLGLPLQHPAIEALGWPLLHFVWQGVAVASVLAVLLIVMRRASAYARYLVECGALVLMAVCPVVTWCCLPTSASIVPVPVAAPVVRPAQNHASPHFPGAAGNVAQSAIPSRSPSDSPSPAADGPSLAQVPATGASAVPADVPQTVEHRWREWTEPCLPWLVGCWVLGVSLLSLRLLLGWRFVQRIKRLSTAPAVETWHQRCRQLATRLKISRPVKLVESALIEVPTVIGWLRPMILFPASALAGLEAAQLEAILAHELAHIRRHDYLVNLIQTVLETLLFYHPAVWWVSRQIRNEREHCCDDIAVEVCGNRVIYARALAEMEELRVSPRLTLAANAGSLLGRIKRLVYPSAASQQSVWWTASPVAIALVGSLIVTAYLSAAAIAEPQELPLKFGVKLNDGVTVQLVGVSSPHDLAKWWQADGSPLEKSPVKSVDMVANDRGISSQSKQRYLVWISGLSQNETAMFIDEDSTNIATGSRIDENFRETFVESYPKAKGATATLRVGLRRDQFGPPIKFGPTGHRLPGPSIPADLRAWYDLITIASITEANGKIQVTLPQFDLRRQRAYPQWRAVDIDEHEIAASEQSNVNVTFALPLSRLSRIEVRLQPYKQWVTFENVSLQPGVKTDVKVSVGGTPSVPVSLLNEKQPPGTAKSPATPLDKSEPSSQSEKLATNVKQVERELEEYAQTVKTLEAQQKRLSAQSGSDPDVAVQQAKIEREIAAAKARLQSAKTRQAQLDAANQDEPQFDLPFVSPLVVPKAAPVGTRVDAHGQTLLAGQIQRFGSTQFRVTGWWRYVGFSADGEWIWGKADNRVFAMHRATGHVVTHGELPIGTGEVASVSVSPSGKLVGVAMWEDFRGSKARTCKVIILDAHTGESKRTLEWISPAPKSLETRALAFSHDDRILLTGQGGDIRLWNVADGKTVRTVEIANVDLWEAAFSPSGDSIALAGSGNSYYWKQADGEIPRVLEPRTDAMTVCYSPHGKWFATGSHGKDGAELWDAQTGTWIGQFQAGVNRSHPDGGMAFSPDSTVLAFPATGANLVELLNTETRQRIATLPAEEPRSVTISRDGKWLATTGGDSRVAIFDLATRTEVNADLPGHSESIRNIVFGGGDSMITGGSDGLVCTWDVTTGKQRHRGQPRHESYVAGMDVSSDGRKLVTISMDHAVLWDIATGQRLQTLGGHGRLGGSPEVVFSPDGTQVASWGNDMFVRWWDVQTGKLVSEKELPLPNYVSPAKSKEMFPSHLSATFTPDSSTLFLIYEKTLYEFDARNGTLRRGVAMPSAWEVTASPDGRWLAMSENRPGEESSFTRRVVLRDRQSLQPVKHWDVEEAFGVSVQDGTSSPAVTVVEYHLGPVVFSSDSKQLAWSAHGTQNAVDVADVTSGKLTNHVPLKSWSGAIEFSADGTRLATGHYDTTAAIWNLADFAVAAPVAVKSETSQLAPTTKPLWSAANAAELSRLKTLLASPEQQVRDEAAKQVRPLFAARTKAYLEGPVSDDARADVKPNDAGQARKEFLQAAAPVLASKSESERQQGNDRMLEVIFDSMSSGPNTLGWLKPQTTLNEAIVALQLTDKNLSGGKGNSFSRWNSYLIDDDLTIDLFIDLPDRVTSASVNERHRPIVVHPPPQFTGTWTTYFNNGIACQQIELRDGKYHGKHRTYHPNGKLSVSMHYQQHLSEGEEVAYFPSGQVMHRGQNAGDTRIGTWKYYDSDGRVRETVAFTKDVPTGTDGNATPKAADKAAEALCVLSGHVLDYKGRLVKGAQVQVWRMEGVRRVDLLAGRTREVTTDEDGWFEIRDLPAGEVKVAATFETGTADKPNAVPSTQKSVVLVPNETAYCRCQFYYPVAADAQQKYLTSGGASNSGTWSKFNFDPRAMQAAGHQAESRRKPPSWGEVRHGLQTVLLLTPGKSDGSRTASLVIRNTLSDRLVAFHRYQAREDFALEVIQPDGKIDTIPRDIWPFNSVPPSHAMNIVYLRPGDEYALSLGEFEHPALSKPPEGVSVRARLKLFSDNELADSVRQEEYFPTTVMETAWVALGDGLPAAPQVPLVNLVVVDEKTGQPIPKFAVIPGTEGSLGAAGEPNSLAQWQPHMWREGQAGRSDWPRERTYDTMRLRVEAEGYRPALTQLIRKADGALTVLMKLTVDSGLEGRVISASGQPIAHAQVGVAMSARTIQIKDRRIDVPQDVPQNPADAWRLPLVVETDASGRFHLPAEVVPALVVVTHESGYADLRRDELTDAASTIVLQPWGKVEGQLLWGDQPGVDEQVKLTTSRPNSDWIPMVSYFASTKTGPDGRFTFEHVPPGMVQIHREQEIANPANAKQSFGHYFPIMFPIMHVNVGSSGPTSIVLGGKGRPVVGQLRGRADWQGVTLRVFPDAPRPGFPHMWAGYSEFAASPQGKLYHREKIPVQADGTFRIENLPAAYYQWQVVGLKGGFQASGTIDIPAMPGGTSDEPFDLKVTDVRPGTNQ